MGYCWLGGRGGVVVVGGLVASDWWLQSPTPTHTDTFFNVLIDGWMLCVLKVDEKSILREKIGGTPNFFNQNIGDDP